MGQKTVLVTGGTGYIGSHTAVELLSMSCDVVIVDNLANSDRSVVDRIEQIAGRRPTLIVGDIRDTRLITEVLREHAVDAVMHFAGFKSVSESCAKPLSYYDTNVVGTVSLLQAMTDAGVRRMVFSSSTTVYGNARAPVTEDASLVPVSPYGRSKLMVEDMLRDLGGVPGSDWRFVILRYFNPVGAHESGIIGEDPRDIPTNLMPYICRVATGQAGKLLIFGRDYATKDGTPVRDFIHVVDLAKGHLSALKALDDSSQKNVIAVNLGTGHGTTVLELVTAFAKVTEVAVPYEFAPRREGDVAVSFADATRARQLLGWESQRGISEMCRDAWRWQLQQSQIPLKPNPEQIADR